MKLKLAATSAETPPRHCPLCEYLVDAASAVNRTGAYQTPTAGDLSVCINCGVPLVFRDDLSLRLLTVEEVMALGAEEADTIWQLLRATNETIQLRRRKAAE